MANASALKKTVGIDEESSTKKLSPIQIVIYVFLVCMAVIYLAPMLWVFTVSF